MSRFQDSGQDFLSAAALSPSEPLTAVNETFATDGADSTFLDVTINYVLL